MKTFVINSRILENEVQTKCVGIPKDRIIYHIQEKTEWVIAFQQGETSFITSIAEKHGDSLVMLRVPTNLLIPSWAD